LKPIVGTKVALRTYNIADAEEIYKWRHDSHTTVWMGRKFRYLPTLDEIRASLQKVISSSDSDSLYFAISDPYSSKYLGGIDLTSIDLTDRNGVLSIVISTEPNRGKGFGSEAIRLLLDHTFLNMNLHKVILNVDARNSVAVNCYKRIGFREEGRQRDHSFVDGRFSDVLLMSILESEFRMPNA